MNVALTVKPEMGKFLILAWRSVDVSWLERFDVNLTLARWKKWHGLWA